MSSQAAPGQPRLLAAHHLVLYGTLVLYAAMYYSTGRLAVTLGRGQATASELMAAADAAMYEVKRKIRYPDIAAP